jgi:hypothetical protein
MPSAFGPLSHEDIRIIRQSFLRLSKRLYLANEQCKAPVSDDVHRGKQNWAPDAKKFG